MALRPILKYPDPRLKLQAQPVTTFDDALVSLVKDMAETMYAAPGVGLAAPQIGVSLRLFVMDPDPEQADSVLRAVVNPEILEASGDMLFEEGCLSLPGFSEEVKRRSKLRVRYQDEHGKTFEADLEGYPAVIFQHEFDHLNGVLATDRISRIKRALYNRARARQIKESQANAPSSSSSQGTPASR